MDLLSTLKTLRDKLVKEGRHKDALEVNHRIAELEGLMVKPCPVIYVDFRNKVILKRVA